jgi:hypothetical protein
MITTPSILAELTVIGKSLRDKAAGATIVSEFRTPLRACRVAYACIRNGANPRDILRGLRANIPDGPELDSLDRLIRKVVKP